MANISQYEALLPLKLLGAAPLQDKWVLLWSRELITEKEITTGVLLIFKLL